MARAIGPSSMLDVRSVSILFAHDYAKRDGATVKEPFRRDTGNLPLREDFDSPESWNLLVCSFGLGLLTLGVLHSVAFLGNFASLAYELSVFQTTLISALMYSVFIIFSPLGSYLVKSWGPQLTATCGLLLGFVGLILMALQVHWIPHLVGNIVFVGIGASFVQTASTCCIVDFFKKHVSVAMLVLSLVSPVSTILFVTFSYFVGIMGFSAYKWIMLCFAMLFVAAVGIIQRFPPTIRIPGHQDSIRAEEVAKKIKDCLKSARVDGGREAEEKSFGELSCTCACVFDCGLLKDVSFYLWGGICFCALLTFYIPMVLVVPYVNIEFHFEYLDALRFICVFSGASILGRTVVFLLNDFTFTESKLYLQAGLLGNAFIYGWLYKADTYGWLLAVCFVLGMTEGVFVIMIPRLTFLILPSKHLSSAWQFLSFSHAGAVLVGPVLMVMLSRVYGGEIYLPCWILGGFQVIAAIFIFLLPEASEGRRPPNEVNDPPKFP